MAVSKWKNSHKDVARSAVMERRALSHVHAKRLRTARVALSLPGDGILCLREGLRSGLYGRQTRHVFVEEIPKTMTLIKKLVDSTNTVLEPLYWADKLHRLNWDNEVGQHIDFAFLDLCRVLDYETSVWLKSLTPWMATGSYFAITLQRTYRNTKYMDFAVNAIFELPEGRRLLEDTWLLINAAKRVGNTHPKYRYLEDDPDGCDAKAPDHYEHPRRERLPGLFPAYHEVSVKTLAAIRLLIPGISFDLDALVEYKRDQATTSGSQMLTIGLANLHVGQHQNYICPRLQHEVRDFFQLASRRKRA